jgi:hypothetical protein
MTREYRAALGVWGHMDGRPYQSARLTRPLWTVAGVTCTWGDLHGTDADRERGAREWALRAAACEWAGEPVELPPTPLWLERFAADVISPAAIEREIEHGALTWMRLDIERLELGDARAAHEAAAALREDGLPVDAVAARSGAEHTREQVLLADTSIQLAARLVGAAPGTVVGPVADSGGHVLVLVRSRLPAAAGDSELRARAERQVLARAIARELAPRIEWH